LFLFQCPARREEESDLNIHLISTHLWNQLTVDFKRGESRTLLVVKERNGGMRFLNFRKFTIFVFVLEVFALVFIPGPGLKYVALITSVADP
jgi:hypothetical protein